MMIAKSDRLLIIFNPLNSLSDFLALLDIGIKIKGWEATS